MCRLLGIILPVYSVTTSVCVITAKAVAAELLQKESTSYITPINSYIFIYLNCKEDQTLGFCVMQECTLHVYRLLNIFPHILVGPLIRSCSDIL